MLHLKNFKQYKSEVETFNGHPYEIRYHKDEKGIDWYDSRPLFKSETYKIMYDTELFYVIQCETDAEMIVIRDGVSVIEMEEIIEVDNILESQRYMVDPENEIIYENPDIPQRVLNDNKQFRSYLMYTVSAHIDTLKDKIEYGLSDDTDLLKKYSVYRIKVSEVDINHWEPEWPESPL